MWSTQESRIWSLHSSKYVLNLIFIRRAPRGASSCISTKYFQPVLMLKVLVRSSAIRSNLFMSCIHFIMLSQEDGCCPLEPKQHQLQTHQTHPISDSLQHHSAAHIDTYVRCSAQQAFCPSPSGACPASPRTPGTCPHPPAGDHAWMQGVPLF